MKRFVSRHSGKIIGVLSGFDRLLLRGTLRQLAHLSGMRSFLAYKRILLKDFTDYAQSVTARVREQSNEIAEAAGMSVNYLPSSQVRKEDLARNLQDQRGIESGLVCVLSCVEPCMGYEIHRNREKQILELQLGIRKCLHYYFYFVDPELGFMHARLQSWLPFSVQLCLNGREWLARQMDRVGIGYRRRDNCFVWLEDVDGAQRLMDEQLHTDWPSCLERVRKVIHPMHDEVFKDVGAPDGVGNRRHVRSSRDSGHDLPSTDPPRDYAVLQP